MSQKLNLIQKFQYGNQCFSNLDANLYSFSRMLSKAIKGQRTTFCEDLLLAERIEVFQKTKSEPTNYFWGRPIVGD